MSEVRCSVYIAASVDGFIARSDGDVRWLERPEYATEESYGLSYGEYIATVDALVMGRHTFETVLTFAEWPYEGVPVVVLTRRGLRIPDSLEGKVRVDGGAPVEVIRRLAERGARHLYIDGGATIRGFLRADLIDEITVTWIPVLLGAGISLFRGLGVERDLVHLETHTAGNGFVQSRYRIGSGPRAF